jgi:hypothetical protein
MPTQSPRGHRRRVAALLAASIVSSLAARAAAQCTKDTDCKGDRVCERGHCVSPGGTQPAATSAATPTTTPSAAPPPEAKPAPPPKQPAPPPLPPAPKPKPPAVEAAALTAEGNKLLAAKSYAEACDRFDRSYAIRPQPSTLASVARCRESAGQAPAAMAAWRKLEAEGGPVYKNQAKAALKKLAAAAPPPPPPPVAPKPSEPPRPSGPMPVTPVKAVSGATWSDNLGFVLPGPAPTEAKSAYVAPEVPGGTEVSLTRVAFGIDATASFVSPMVFGGAPLAVAPRIGFSIRAEFRRQSSWLAPWFEIPHFGSYTPGDSPFVRVALGAAPRVGIDLHPGRTQIIGFGPFIGYRIGLMFAGGGSAPPKLENGVDLAPLHIHLRTREIDGAPPTFDMVSYIVERMSGPFHAEVVGLRIGLGGGARFRIVGEYRLHVGGTYSRSDDVFATYAASFPEQAFVGIGIGSAE